MNMWVEAFDDLAAIERENRGMTVDQKLKAVEIRALLAIGQDLNALRLKDFDVFD